MNLFIKMVDFALKLMILMQVGQSGKHDDISKIGKYGLGFNCAYHFTDVVSFITRDQLVIFDPHGEHLPGNLLGMRCNFIEKELRDEYPAQATPLLWEAGALPFCETTLREPLDGTLFRLPLRTEAQAGRSKIVNNCFSDDEIVRIQYINPT